jgi:hypothetical protein
MLEYLANIRELQVPFVRKRAIAYLKDWQSHGPTTYSCDSEQVLHREFYHFIYATVVCLPVVGVIAIANENYSSDRIMVLSADYKIYDVTKQLEHVNNHEQALPMKESLLKLFFSPDPPVIRRDVYSRCCSLRH